MYLLFISNGLDTRYVVMINNEKEEIEGLLKKVYENYKKFPLTQKKDICEQVAKIVEVSVPSSLDPITCPHKGRPPHSFKRGKKVLLPTIIRLLKSLRRLQKCVKRPNKLLYA